MVGGMAAATRAAAAAALLLLLPALAGALAPKEIAGRYRLAAGPGSAVVDIAEGGPTLRAANIAVDGRPCLTGQVSFGKLNNALVEHLTGTKVLRELKKRAAGPVVNGFLERDVRCGDKTAEFAFGAAFNFFKAGKTFRQTVKFPTDPGTDVPIPFEKGVRYLVVGEWSVYKHEGPPQKPDKPATKLRELKPDGVQASFARRFGDGPPEITIGDAGNVTAETCTNVTLQLGATDAGATTGALSVLRWRGVPESGRLLGVFKGALDCVRKTENGTVKPVLDKKLSIPGGKNIIAFAPSFPFSATWGELIPWSNSKDKFDFDTKSVYVIVGQRAVYQSFKPKPPPGSTPATTGKVTSSPASRRLWVWAGPTIAASVIVLVIIVVLMVVWCRRVPKPKGEGHGGVHDRESGRSTQDFSSYKIPWHSIRR